MNFAYPPLFFEANTALAEIRTSLDVRFADELCLRERFRVSLNSQKSAFGKTGCFLTGDNNVIQNTGAHKG